MMPKMDGIEAAQIIRSLGYTNYIIALTANALIGQAEMFLKNGFDGYISKPIDSRELDVLLNDFIRNKKPPEVVEAARQEQRDKENKNMVISAHHMTKANEIEKFFIMDAENALNILENIKSNLHNLEDSGMMNSYIIAVHGIKSALANIGETQLANIAFNLEKAGRDRDYALISDLTPALINSLNVLIEKFKPMETDNDIEILAEDKKYLSAKLNDIITACAAIDKKTAKAALNSLKQKKWPKYVNTALDDIAVQLLHSEFRKAAVVADNCLQAAL
jgi:CheY-like chemotaxis protein